MEPIMEAKRDEALSFLVNHDIGVLATISSSGEPRARTLYYTCDDSFNIYFLTFKNTRKVDDLTSHPQAAFVVSEIAVPRTIQIEGKVTDLTDTAINDPLLVGFLHRLTSSKPYGIPLMHLDTSAFTFYRLTPDRIQWGDFTSGEGTRAVLTEIET